MIAGQNGDRNGAARPLWITGLSPPDSWRSLRQPGYQQLHRARHPQHRVWGYDRKSGVSDFRLSKVCSFRLPLTHALEGSIRLHVPFGGVEIVLDVLARREIPLVVFERLDHWPPCLDWDIRGLRKRLNARDDIRVSFCVELRISGLPDPFDQFVPIPLQGTVRRQPVGLGRTLVWRRHIVLRGDGKCPGVIFGFDRRNVVGELGRRRFTFGRQLPGRVPRYRIGTPGRFGAAAFQRQPPLAAIRV